MTGAVAPPRHAPYYRAVAFDPAARFPVDEEDVEYSRANDWCIATMRESAHG